MTKVDKEKIEELVALKYVPSDSKRDALLMYRKYIDANALFCLSCDASVRQMFERLKKWWVSQTVAYTFIKTIESTKKTKK